MSDRIANLPTPANLPVATPAFVYDESLIVSRARLFEPVRRVSGCSLLYAIKAFPFVPVLQLLEPWVDGYSVSSAFEAELAASACAKPFHITTPGFRTESMEAIGSHCRFVAFNSLDQLRRLQESLPDSVSLGLRLNPQLSFSKDARYDPCRAHSKLGVPLSQLATALRGSLKLSTRLRGLHFHTVYSSRSFEPLKVTLRLIEAELHSLLPSLDWLNIGGGYLYQNERDLAPLAEIIAGFRQRWNVEVYFEPGNALVGDAGYLVASVIDLFENEGKTIAILDTSVNHHPETFEYQTRPTPAWVEPATGFPAWLTGCTCLAGDVFGEYRFQQPLKLGDRIAFRGVGAYSLIKASRFNGYNLPNIFAWDGNLAIRLMKTYRYGDYHQQWSADEATNLGYDRSSSSVNQNP